MFFRDRYIGPCSPGASPPVHLRSSTAAWDFRCGLLGTLSRYIDKTRMVCYVVLPVPERGGGRRGKSRGALDESATGWYKSCRLFWDIFSDAAGRYGIFGIKTSAACPVRERGERF